MRSSLGIWSDVSEHSGATQLYRVRKKRQLARSITGSAVATALC